MHVGGAPHARRHRPIPFAVPLTRRALLILSLVCSGFVACSRGSDTTDGVVVTLTFVPDALTVAEPLLGRIAIRDREGHPIRATDLRVEAHMTHPGMTPVLAEGTERSDGVHEVQLQFTMAGDWVVHVTGTLADGRRIDEWIDVPGVSAGSGGRQN